MTFNISGVHILLPLCPLPVLPDQEIVSCILIKIYHFLILFAISVINLDRYVNIFLNLFDVLLNNLNSRVNIFLTWLSARGLLHNTIQAACNPKNDPANMFQ